MEFDLKNIVVLGSTGSVGTQTLDLVRSFPEEIKGNPLWRFDIIKVSVSDLGDADNLL